MTEIILSGQRFNLASPNVVGENPPMTERPKSIVLFFDTPEQAEEFARFCAALPSSGTAMDIPEF